MVKSARSIHDLKGSTPFLGLTGGIGSGKSIVAELLAKRGAWIIDTDRIAHQITASGGLAITAIAQQFGPEFIDSDGSLNRAKMRNLVFSDSQAKHRLEAITHPLIGQETMSQAMKALEGKPVYLTFVVPLLVESGAWVENLDHIAVVDCDEEVQIQRVMERNALEREAVLRIMAHQATRAQRLAIANTIINNNGDLSTLERAVEDLHQKMMDL
jgi:dephospho-CoA kinase